MAKPFVFETWPELPTAPPATGSWLHINDSMPRTCPLPMDPSWYVSYYPRADKAMHESYRTEVETVRTLLNSELVAADPRLTQRRTACVLATENGLYAGHVEEKGIGQFTTAASMALANLQAAEPDTKITRIYLTGQNVKKPKYVMPIPEDYDRLAEHFEGWGPTMIIVSPDADDYTSVWASVHGPAYSAKPPSDFRDFFDADEDATTFPELIKSRTILTYNDAEFIAQLMFFGRANSLGIYLTGSASGRGEISNALKRDYEDMDLLVVAGGRDIAVVNACILEIAEQYFGTLRVEPMVSYNYDTGEAFPGIYLFDGSGRKRVQVQTGPTMQSINFRPGNLARNFFHRVS